MVKKIVVLGPESTGKSTLCEMLAQHFDTLWCPEFAREYLLTNGTDYDFDDLLTIAKGQMALEEEYLRMMEPPSIPPALAGQAPQGGSSLRRSSRLSTPNSPLPDFPSSQLSDSRLPTPVSLLRSPYSDLWTPVSGLPTPVSQLPSPNSRLLFIDTDQYVMKVWCEYVFGDCHNWILRRIAERPYDLYLLCKPDLPWVQDELREYPDEKPRQELYHMYKDILLNQTVSWAEIYGSYNQRFELARNAVMTLC